MSGNSFGNIFKITSFGESHGKALGVVIDSCPSGLEIDMDFLNTEMNRRRPGQSDIVTQRDEADLVKILSGVFEGKTTGTPLAMVIWNKDQKSKDYDNLKDLYRPSHADYSYTTKYGIRDHRGGGRASARETAARVAAGAIAKLLLKQSEISIQAFVRQIGNVSLDAHYSQLDLSKTESSNVRCPDPIVAAMMEQHIAEVRDQGDSLGGVIQCIIKGAPAGLGEPVFDKLHAELGKAMLSINAVKGFEIGSGFSAASMKGSDHNDSFVKNNDVIQTTSNHSGGIQGGISNGMDIYFKVAFKPPSTIMKEQQSIDKSGNEVNYTAVGRHDPCVVPRAVPIVEAMAALVMADMLLRARSNRI